MTIKYPNKPGSLNPTNKSTFGQGLDRNLTSFMQNVKKQTIDHYSEDVLQDISRLKAVVLFAWKEMDPLIDREMVYVKARIPELDVIPFPTLLPAANNPQAPADWSVINTHRTYVSENTQISDLGLPAPGQVVYVRLEQQGKDLFEHSQQQGVYVGPVNVEEMPNPLALTETPKVAWVSSLSSLDWNSAPSFNLRGNWSKGLDKERVLYLSQQLQMDPNIVAAFQMVESGGNPTVFAWNAHIMRKRFVIYYGKDKAAELLQKARAVQLADATATAASAKEAGKGQPRSVYRSKAEKLFNIAYTRVDPKAAVAGGAWGNYQVLGLFAFKYIDYIKNAANPPAEVIKRFKEDPAKFSDDMLVAWVTANGGIGGKWHQAAANPTGQFKFRGNPVDGYTYLVARFYGGPKQSYIDKLRAYHDQFNKERTFSYKGK